MSAASHVASKQGKECLLLWSGILLPSVSVLRAVLCPTSKSLDYPPLTSAPLLRLLEADAGRYMLPVFWGLSRRLLVCLSAPKARYVRKRNGIKYE